MEVMLKNLDRNKIIYGIYHGNVLGYIGQTSDFFRRKFRHLNPVRRKARRVDIWLNSVSKNVYFKILEECKWYESRKREIYWKRKLNPIVID